MKSNSEVELVKVYEGNIVEATTIKEILEENNIEVILENETMSSIEPRAIQNGLPNLAKLVVTSQFSKKALELVEQQERRASSPDGDN